MAARCSKVLARCASAILSLVGLQSCADDGVSLHVICPIFPELEEDACTWDPAGETCVLEGAMNMKVAKAYTQSLRVESGLVARKRAVPPQGEPNGIQIRKARVDVRLPSGERLGFTEPTDPNLPPVPNPYDVVAVGYVVPEGVGAVTATLMPSQYVNALRGMAARYPQIVLRVTLSGKTSGGQEVTAGEYAWPVRLFDDVELPCSKTAYCEPLKGQDGFANTCTTVP